MAYLLDDFRRHYNTNLSVVNNSLFISRFIPFICFDVVSYGAGLTNMSLRAIILASFFGMLPLTFIYNQFGAGLVMNQALAVFLGILLVILMFIVPRMIERYNLFSLQQYFRHAKEKRLVAK